MSVVVAVVVASGNKTLSIAIDHLSTEAAPEAAPEHSIGDENEPVDSSKPVGDIPAAEDRS